MQFNGYRIDPVFPKFGVSVENKCAVCSEKKQEYQSHNANAHC